MAHRKSLKLVPRDLQILLVQDSKKIGSCCTGEMRVVYARIFGRTNTAAQNAMVVLRVPSLYDP